MAAIRLKIDSTKPVMASLGKKGLKGPKYHLDISMALIDDAWLPEAQDADYQKQESPPYRFRCVSHGAYFWP